MPACFLVCWICGASAAPFVLANTGGLAGSASHGQAFLLNALLPQGPPALAAAAPRRAAAGGMNKYEVLGIVGEGAYGVVLRCRNRVSARAGLGKARASRSTACAGELLLRPAVLALLPTAGDG